MKNYSYLDSKSGLIEYIKYYAEEENIEIYSSKGVYGVNFYDKERDKIIGEIFDHCKKNDELILGVKWY